MYKIRIQQMYPEGTRTYPWVWRVYNENYITVDHGTSRTRDAAETIAREVIAEDKQNQACRKTYEIIEVE